MPCLGRGSAAGPVGRSNDGAADDDRAREGDATGTEEIPRELVELGDRHRALPEAEVEVAEDRAEACKEQGDSEPERELVPHVRLSIVVHPGAGVGCGKGACAGLKGFLDPLRSAHLCHFKHPL